MTKVRAVVYSVEACRHCAAAKAALSQSGVDYVEVVVSRHPTIRQWLLKSVGSATVPQIFFGRRHIGGNEQLQQLIADTERWQEAVRQLDEDDEGGGGDDGSQIPPVPALPDVPGDDIDVSSAISCRPGSDPLAAVCADLREHSDLFVNRRWHVLCSARRSFSGEQLVSWLLSDRQIDKETAVGLASQLLDKHYIVSATGANERATFQPTDSSLYRLLDDIFGSNSSLAALNVPDDCVGNCDNVQCTVVSATELSAVIRRSILKLYEQHISADGSSVNYGAIGSSDGWRRFIELVRHLRRTDISSLSVDERLAFFINIYNALVIHGIIHHGPPNNIWQRWKFFNSVSYVISGWRFSLQDIENGVLRANRRPLGAVRSPFNSGDSRQCLALPAAEPRIHFALNCGAKSCPPIKTFSAKDIHSELDLATASFLSTDQGVYVSSDGRVCLSKLFKWYQADFGQTDREVLHWVLQHMEGGSKRSTLDHLISTGAFRVSYLPYDWSINAQ